MGMRDTNKQEIRANNLQSAREAKERRKLNPEPKMKRRKRFWVSIKRTNKPEFTFWVYAHTKEEAKWVAKSSCEKVAGFENFEITEVTQKKKGEGLK